MSIAELLLPETDQEMAGTRKTLEHIPDDKLDWKANPKSNTLRWVGSHLAEIPGWIPATLTEGSWDFEPPGGEPYRTPLLENRDQMLQVFDKHVVEARKAIAATSDAEFGKQWSLLKGGTVLFTVPRYTVTRNFMLNHMIHHRAYLCAYLRQNNIPVPSLYGPSGDE